MPTDRVAQGACVSACEIWWRATPWSQNRECSSHVSLPGLKHHAGCNKVWEHRGPEASISEEKLSALTCQMSHILKLLASLLAFISIARPVSSVETGHVFTWHRCTGHCTWGTSGSGGVVRRWSHTAFTSVTTEPP